MLESRKSRSEVVEDREITTALLLNVILLRGKLTFKRILIFSYHYLKDSLGLKQIVWDKGGHSDLQKSLSVCLKRSEVTPSPSLWHKRKEAGTAPRSWNEWPWSLCQVTQLRIDLWSQFLQEVASAGRVQKYKKVLGKFMVDRWTWGY